MLRKEFYNEVKKLRKKGFRPFLDDFDSIRFQDVNGYEHCPITAVAKALNGGEYDIPEYDTAARFLGISQRDADIIAKGADKDLRHIRIYKKLLKLTGLDDYYTD